MAKFREQKTITGDFMRVNIYPTRQYQYGRKQKSKPTSATQARLNELKRTHYLGDIINLNFSKRSHQIKLDYSAFIAREGRNPTADECVREMRNFIRRLKRRFGKNIKYIYATELGVRGGKSHHHMIVDESIAVSEIYELWSAGGVWSRKLYFDKKGCFDLAGYFVKSKYSYRSYTCSKNLIRPREEGKDKCVFKSDYTIRQKQVNTILNGELEELSRLYPGWSLAALPEVAHTIDQNTGEVSLPTWGVFITIYFYKPEGLSDGTQSFKRYQDITEWRDTNVTEKCV